MEYRYDYAFGSGVFTEDGSFKCPVCGKLTPGQRKLANGEKIVCRVCKSVFKKTKWLGVRFVEYGPQFHICFKMVIKSSQ